VRLSARRVRAILRKELRDYRRNRQIVVSMAVLPLVFSIYPAVELFALPASASGVLLHTQALVYMLAIPAIVPAVVAAYSVAGERQQDTLEPVLTTPIRAEELLLGKGLAALAPSLASPTGSWGPSSPPLSSSPSRPWRQRSSAARSCSPSSSSRHSWPPCRSGRASPSRPGRATPGSPPSSACSSVPPDRRDHRHLDRRAPRDARARPRPRGRPAAHRRPGVADRVAHARPRAAHHRSQIVRGRGGAAVAGLSSQERPTEPPDGGLPLEVRQAVRLMRRRSGSAGQEVHAEPGPADQPPDTA
jgi:hypothetical protein